MKQMAIPQEESRVEVSLGQDAVLSLVTGNEEPCLKFAQEVVGVFDREN